jgi:hypothetical protein
LFHGEKQSIREVLLVGFSLFFAKAKVVVGKRNPGISGGLKKGIPFGPERLPKSIMI